MSVIVTWNGTNFIVPETNEVGWGSNLTSYLVALPAGALQKTGGSFTLSAETDFGASFGLKSLSYKSRSSNIASTGILRLNNNSDAVSWRNFANSADLALLVNTSNQLTFNGTPIGGSGIFTASRAIVSDGSGNLSSATTTSAEIGYVNGVTSAIQTQINSKKTIATGNAYKFETTDVSGNLQETTVTASRAVETDANGLPVASVTTASELAFVNGVTSSIQTQINSKAPTASPTFTGTITTPLTASRALTTGASSELAVSTTTAAELAFVSGVTSAIQTQINNKLSLSGGTLTGDITFASGKGEFYTDSGTNTVKLTAPTTITSTYTLKWPVAQGASNQYLTNDGLGNLSWTNAAGTGTVNSGTQFQLAYYATSTNAVSGLTLITANRALASDANGLPVASATTAAELAFVSGVTSAIQTQINTKSPSANPTFTGVVLIANGTAALPSLAFASDPDTGIYSIVANAMGFTVGGGVRVELYSTSMTMNVPVYGIDGTAASPSLTFTLDPDTGIWRPAANTVGIATAGVDRLRINTDFFPTDDNTMSNGKSGNRWSKLYTVGIVGTTTNNNAAAGDVGEYTEAKSSTNTNFPATVTYDDANSISLTAGDWDVTFQVKGISNGATWSQMNIGVSSTSGNSSTGLSDGDNLLSDAWANSSTTPLRDCLTITSYRVSLSATTTYYGKIQATYTAGTPQYVYRLSARRVR